MKKLFVQAGSLKKKSISAPTLYKKHSNFTTAVVKKSVFSITDSFFLFHKEILKQETIFVDLFSGSGQMGIEALSQGFLRAVFFEISRERFSNLKKQVLNFKGNFELFHKDAFRYFYSFSQNSNEKLVYFLDPPYEFWQMNFKKMRELIDKIQSKNNVLTIILQANKNLNLRDFKVRRFGKTYLHLLE